MQVVTEAGAVVRRAEVRYRDSKADLMPTLEPAPIVFDLERLEVYYGAFRAVRDVTLQVRKNEITAFIGPSGCGKTTVLRCLNRMNDLIPGARVGGKVCYHGVDLYGDNVSASEVRRRIGMVFQKPNPFPKSIYDNIAFGARINGVTDRTKLDEVVEKSLRAAALWDEVKDRLRNSALACPAASNSGCVSPARSRSNPRSC